MLDKFMPFITIGIVLVILAVFLIERLRLGSFAALLYGRRILRQLGTVSVGQRFGRQTRVVENLAPRVLGQAAGIGLRVRGGRRGGHGFAAVLDADQARQLAALLARAAEGR